MKRYYRYLPLSEEMHKRSVSVLAAGYHVSHLRVPERYNLSRPNIPYPPLIPPDHVLYWSTGRTLQEHQLIYVTRGRGLFESKTCPLRTIKTGDLFAVFPGEWHRYGPNTSDGWDDYWVAFIGRAAAEYVAECQLSVAEPVIEVGIDTRLIEEFIGITDELRDIAEGHQEIMAARTLLILGLAKAARLRKNSSETYMARTIERAKNLLLERLDETPPLEEVAVSLGVSYSWFRKMFLRYTGMSPAQYHLQYRIQRACNLLTGTTVPIATIGESLGFESGRYFSRIFRQKTGYTPRDYRARTQIPSSPE
jgi:AraC-like DNA-binding protein